MTRDIRELRPLTPEERERYLAGESMASVLGDCGCEEEGEEEPDATGRRKCDRPPPSSPGR